MHIRFSPKILRRLGEELNVSPDQGILELVKNAYDADALRCTVELRETNNSGGTILITDDGDGMLEEQIEDGWLLLGSSKKVQTAKTRLGRSPAGNKGLGRLAALRMGRGVALTTRPRESPGIEYKLDIDWSEYHGVDAVEDVSIDVLTEDTSAGKGTEIEIQDLRQRLTRMDVKRLARGLLMLSDPFSDLPSGFNPVLNAPEYKDLEELVARRYFRDADFHLRLKVNDQGWATAEVLDLNGRQLFRTEHDELRRSKTKEPYDTPAFSFDLWVFVLSQQSFTNKPTTLTEVKEWLKEFGGVYLYVRGLRVAPYVRSCHVSIEGYQSRIIRLACDTSVSQSVACGPG